MCKVISKLGNDSVFVNIIIVDLNEIIIGMLVLIEGVYMFLEFFIRILVLIEGVNIFLFIFIFIIGISYFVKCVEKEKIFCVNGGECFMVKDFLNFLRYLCKC